MGCSLPTSPILIEMEEGWDGMVAGRCVCRLGDVHYPTTDWQHEPMNCGVYRMIYFPNAVKEVGDME